MKNKTGVELIAAERDRQIVEEGYDVIHDDYHKSGELSLAAIAYAAPTRIFMSEETATGVIFCDPFPDDWRDKRRGYGDVSPSKVLPDPETYTKEERIDLLVKAGALIAAEIDRLTCDCRGQIIESDNGDMVDSEGDEEV
jgi:hypothetical protein